MWFDGYHQQFGKRLEEFHAVAIPAMLEELSPEQEEQVTQGSKEFPFDAVLDVLNSKDSCQMRVFGTGVLGTRYCRVPGSWYRAEGYVGPGR